MSEIFTIGHSNHDIIDFLAILKRHRIELLVDVRSEPHSRYAPQFNKRELQQAVQGAGIRYRYSGSCIGGKPKDESLYTPAGKPDYDLLAATDTFKRELDAVVDLADKAKTILMCSEADPMACHRERILAQVLRGRGVQVTHIMPDGRVEQVAQQGLF